MLDQSDSYLKRSLGLVSAYTTVDEEMAVCYITIQLFLMCFNIYYSLC